MPGRLDLSASFEATGSIYNFSMILIAILCRYIALAAKVLSRYDRLIRASLWGLNLSE
jgi:hypothetical protein